MRAATGDELAAIAAAYALVAGAAERAAASEAPRWRLAARLPACEEPQLVRVTARCSSRWRAAGRLDD